MFTSLWRKSANPIALDLGATGVKMLQLAPVGSAGSIQVIAKAQRALSDDLSPHDVAYHHAIARIVQELLQDGRFRGRTIVSSLPATVVTYKNLRLPRMPDDELASAVQWEARDRVEDDQPLAVQFLNAGKVRQGEQWFQEIVLMAVPEAFIDQHARTLTDAGVELHAIETAPVALGRWLACAHEPPAPGQAQVVIDIGADTTKILVVRDQVVRFFKPIDIGGRRFDQAIAAKLELDEQGLSALRQRLSAESTPTGPHHDDDDSRAQVRHAVNQAVRSSVDDLANEIALCLRYYSVTFRGERPDKATVIGGFAGQPWLIDMLGDRTGLSLEAVAPADPSWGGAWALAAGLSLRGTPPRRKREAA